MVINNKIIKSYYFKDSYALSFNGSDINISETGITWPDDIGKKFKQTPNSETTQWINPEDGIFSP